MAFYEDRVLPRLLDVTLGKPFEQTRARVCGELDGEVLEVGFGSGRNVPHYPAAVQRVRAVDPASSARRLAERRLAVSGVPVEFVGLDGQRLPLEDAAVDHVLITWTLCSIPDAELALAEIRRVLRPGGRMHFVEHGRSPVARTARWQQRANPVWGRVFGGCRLDRPVPDLIEGSGLRLERLDVFDVPGPSIATHMFAGVATV